MKGIEQQPLHVQHVPESESVPVRDEELREWRLGLIRQAQLEMDNGKISYSTWSEIRSAFERLVLYEFHSWRRSAGKLSPDVAEDVFQDCMITLLRAVQLFNLQTPHEFSSYLMPAIRHTLRRAEARYIFHERSGKEKAYIFLLSELETQNCSDEEIAQKMGIPLKDIGSLRALRQVQPAISLDLPIHFARTSETTLVDMLCSLEQGYEQVDQRQYLGIVIDAAQAILSPSDYELFLIWCSLMLEDYGRGISDRIVEILLRAEGTVNGVRDGRIISYRNIRSRIGRMLKKLRKEGILNTLSEVELPD